MKIFRYLLLLISLPMFVACFQDNTTPADRPLSNTT